MQTNPTPDALVERVAQAIWANMLVTRQANDVRHWDERNWESKGWKCHTPALDEEAKERLRSAARAALAAMQERIERLEKALGDAKEAIYDVLCESNGCFDNGWKRVGSKDAYEWEMEFPVASFGKAIEKLDTAYSALTALGRGE